MIRHEMAALCGALAEARAYVYHGQWVADCPAGCGSTEHLYRRRWALGRKVRRAMFACTFCGQVAPIRWAPDEVALVAALSCRPLPQTRNWYPAAHPVAVRAGIPHGQTPTELAVENAEHGV